jgi:hypothetical protein
MARSIRRIITLTGIGCSLIAAPAWADQLRMECQVAQGAGAREPLGGYAFVFDSASGSLSVNMHSSTPSIPLFGFDVKKWTLLFAQGGRAVFYGITPEGLSPVQIFSLNFEKPNMLSYQMGGDGEELIAGFPQYKARCRRLN